MATVGANRARRLILTGVLAAGLGAGAVGVAGAATPAGGQHPAPSTPATSAGPSSAPGQSTARCDDHHGG
jgi:hypothetical protein